MVRISAMHNREEMEIKKGSRMNGGQRRCNTEWRRKGWRGMERVGMIKEERRGNLQSWNKRDSRYRSSR